MRQKRLKFQKFATFGAKNMRVMKVLCPECGGAAIIRKTNRKHRQISDLYCACNDVECGHTFVMNVTFSHTISPSAKTGDKLIKTVVDSMNLQQRQMMLNLLQGSVAAA
ncbi:ogr/Delta-like zinc finger family protein [Yersinia ruckeri]|uniref:ogr/Delta-like zinc finger family protein n=1 Tax=Yersinia ruckeri TaxID=29486 RepID=UPI0008FDAC16|nr:ogr/Delta-like zinc finger family protein [Yersinia ruckeri]EKN4181799.1 ogr/Delta-like zinc finger family protein [Yersinia ruckeri]EKN4704474.1 ogr/Delta-like zinc finger family protein [Yersinia ruckeri]MCK8554487.1 ogr/Delta-like zinc finger family protein [Yersinia ruckeri]MCW6545532.1 ogr/Delta-like zinc finger family protein [Yersinia ruckeri]MCW6571162.1 ogr/Delta-like zinc finger family protein [Yersinia ruckeri]